MDKEQKISTIIAMDSVSVLIHDFFSVYITLNMMSRLQARELAMCMLAGSFISLITNKLLTNEKVIDKLVKYYLLVIGILTIVHSSNVFILYYNALLFSFINTIVFCGLLPLQTVLVDDILNNKFIKRERTMFTVRRRWIFAISSAIASILSMVIDDKFILIDNLTLVFIMFVLSGLSDMYTVKMCKSL